MKKTFFKRDWGFLHGEVSRYHFDILPRFTIVSTPHVLEINIGFACFRIWMHIFSRAMQEFNKNTRLGEK